MAGKDGAGFTVSADSVKVASKGNPEHPDDHRGIAVSTCLSKLYSLVILNRMDKWAENGGLRAAGQAGFRHGRGGAADNSFVLCTLIEKYKFASKQFMQLSSTSGKHMTA